MNGIEKITARIEEDGKAENEALLAQARAEAADITAKYQAQAKAEADEILAQGRKNAEERARHLDTMAQMECRKALLAAKQDVIEEAFQLAHKKLLELPSEKYVALLAELAVSASTTGREKLIFSPSHRAQVGKAVVMAANKKLAEAVSPKLPEEVTETRAGPCWTKWYPARRLSSAVRGCSPWPRRPGRWTAALSSPTARWRSTAPLTPSSGSSAARWRARWPKCCLTDRTLSIESERGRKLVKKG